MLKRTEALLKVVLEGVDLDYRPDDLRKAIQRMETLEADDSASNWQSLIYSIGQEVGLRFVRVEEPLEAILHELGTTIPWIGVCDGEAVVLQGSSGSKVNLWCTNGFSSTLKRGAAMDWLASRSKGDWVWMYAEPAAPLSTIRSVDLAHPKLPWDRLKGLMAAERTTLWIAVIYSVVIGLLTLVVPVAVQSLVNSVAFGSVLQPLVVLTLFVFLALGFSAAMNAMRAFVVEIIQRSVFARVSSDMTWRLLRVRAEVFDRHFGPELVNRFFDTITVQKSAASLLIDGLNIFMQTIIGMILLAIYHPWLLAFDAMLVAIMLLIVFGLGRGAVYTAIKESKAKYAMVAWLEQMAANIITFKSAGGIDYATERSQALLEEWMQYRTKHFKILLRQIAGSFLLQAIASSALLGIGGWLVINRQLTLGQLVASEIIVSLLVSGFTKFGKQLEVFYDLMAAIDKLGGVVDLPLERSGGEASLTGSGPIHIALQNLRVKFENRPEALYIQNFQLAAGARLGLIGHHGSGKSTLTDILFGLRQQESGAVLFNEIDSRDVPLEQLRRSVAIVKGIEIFPGTILDNIRMGRREIGHARVREVLEQLGMLDGVLGLKNGLETELHPSGRPLSQSQACRLMLARAIVGNPRLLVIDDALEQIDRRQDRDEIADILFSPKAPWTLICVTERADLLARCNRIVVLEDGDLRESSYSEVHV